MVWLKKYRDKKSDRASLKLGNVEFRIAQNGADLLFGKTFSCSLHFHDTVERCFVFSKSHLTIFVFQ